MYNVFTSSVVGLRLLPAAVFIYCQETRRGGANARPDVAFLFVLGYFFRTGKTGSHTCFLWVLTLSLWAKRIDTKVSILLGLQFPLFLNSAKIGERRPLRK